MGVNVTIVGASQLASSTRSPPLSLQSSLHQHPLAHTPTHPLGASPALQLDLTTHHRTHPRQIPVANDSSAAPDSGVFSDQPLVWPPTILSPTAVHYNPRLAGYLPPSISCPCLCTARAGTTTRSARTKYTARDAEHYKSCTSIRTANIPEWTSIVRATLFTAALTRSRS